MNTVSERSFEKALDKIRSLSRTNAELLEALELARGSVQWMADATDADPEDHERLAVVTEAIRTAKDVR